MADDARDGAPRQVSAVPRPRRGAFAFLIVLLVVLWAAAMLFRWELRAQWWVYQAMRADSGEDRSYYVRCLASIRDKSLPVVPRLLNASRPDVREAGIFVLRFCREREAADLLADQLSDPDPELAALAATALAWRGDASQYVPRLSSALQAKRNDLSAWGLVVALGRIGGAQAEQSLLDALAAPEILPEIRAQLIDSLGMMGCTRAVPLILDALTDARPLRVVPQSQLSAKRAIGSLAPQLTAQGADPQHALASIRNDSTVAAVAAHWARLLAGTAGQAVTSQPSERQRQVVSEIKERWASEQAPPGSSPAWSAEEK